MNNTRILGAFSYTFYPEYIDDEIVKSAKYWLDIKDLKYRNFCPFILKHARCKDLCGRIFKSKVLKENVCPRQELRIEDFSRIVQHIVNIYKKK